MIAMDGDVEVAATGLVTVRCRLTCARGTDRCRDGGSDVAPRQSRKSPVPRRALRSLGYVMYVCRLQPDCSSAFPPTLNSKPQSAPRYISLALYLVSSCDSRKREKQLLIRSTKQLLWKFGTTNLTRPPTPFSLLSTGL